MSLKRLSSLALISTRTSIIFMKSSKLRKLSLLFNYCFFPSRHPSNAQIDMSGPKHANGSATSQSNEDDETIYKFRTPAFVKHFFDQYPKVTYAANELPLRVQHHTPRHSKKAHALLAWTTENDAWQGRASFNPICLGWQVFLKSRNIDFYLVPSNNHASVSTRLPCLAVNKTSPAPFKRNITMSEGDIDRWASEQEGDWTRQDDKVYESYLKLLDNEIRRAWTYHMYLTKNYEILTRPWYIDTQSSSWAVRVISSWELQRDAKLALQKYKKDFDAEGIYSTARVAFTRLENAVKRRSKEAPSEKPTVVEATLFAYVFLLSELPYDKWADTGLVDIVRENDGLVEWYEAMKPEFGALDPPVLYEQV